MNIINNNFWIEEIYIDGIKSNKPSIGYTFQGPSYHNIIILMNISKNDSIYGMFMNIKDLISISFTSLFNTSNIYNIGHIFNKGCTYLKSVNLSSFDTSKITWFCHMFKGCENIE